MIGISIKTRKKARGAAEKAWKKLKPIEQKRAVLFERVSLVSVLDEIQVAPDKDCRQKPATWLNAHQWTE